MIHLIHLIMISISDARPRLATADSLLNSPRDLAYPRSPPSCKCHHHQCHLHHRQHQHHDERLLILRRAPPSLNDSDWDEEANDASELIIKVSLSPWESTHNHLTGVQRDLWVFPALTPRLFQQKVRLNVLGCKMYDVREGLGLQIFPKSWHCQNCQFLEWKC